MPHAHVLRAVLCAGALLLAEARLEPQGFLGVDSALERDPGAVGLGLVLTQTSAEVVAKPPQRPEAEVAERSAGPSAMPAADSGAEPAQGWADRLHRLLFASPLSCVMVAVKRLEASELGRQHAAAMAALRQRLGSEPVAGVPAVCVMMIGLFFSLVILVTLWSAVWEKYDPADDIPNTAGAWPHAHVPAIYPMPVLPPGVPELWLSRSAMQMALQGQGKCPVLGPTGMPLLSVWLQGRFWSGGGTDTGAPPPWLEVASVLQPNVEPICIGPMRLGAARASQVRKLPMEIHMPGGGLFGEMLPHPSGWSVLHKGQMVLIVNTLNSFPQLSAVAMDGRVVAAMSIETRPAAAPPAPPAPVPGFGGTAAGQLLPPKPEEHILITLDPYSDGLMPFACLLAAALMTSPL